MSSNENAAENNNANSEMVIPDYAIEKLAYVLFPLMQEYFETEQKKAD